MTGSRSRSARTASADSACALLTGVRRAGQDRCRFGDRKPSARRRTPRRWKRTGSEASWSGRAPWPGAVVASLFTAKAAGGILAGRRTEAIAARCTTASGPNPAISRTASGSRRSAQRLRPRASWPVTLPLARAAPHRDDHGDDRNSRSTGASHQPAADESIGAGDEESFHLGAQSPQVGVNHHLDQRFERHRRLPAQFGAGAGRIGDQQVDFGRPIELRVDDHVLAPVEADVRERHFHQLLHRVGLAGADDVVLRRVLLQHAPHRVDVVAGESPVALGIEVAHAQLGRQTELDACHGVRDLASHELDAASRRLVIEQDAAHRIQPVRLAIVHGDPVTVQLGDAVG